MSNREVTLFDVAKGAGVSMAATSRALNDKDGVRVEVREHIQSVADELNLDLDIPAAIAELEIDLNRIFNQN